MRFLSLLKDALKLLYILFRHGLHGITRFKIIGKTVICVIRAWIFNLIYRLQIALKSQYEHFLVSSVCVKGSFSLKISSSNACKRSRNSSSKKAKLFTGIFGLRGSPISITGEIAFRCCPVNVEQGRSYH